MKQSHPFSLDLANQVFTNACLSVFQTFSFALLPGVFDYSLFNLFKNNVS